MTFAPLTITDDYETTTTATKRKISHDDFGRRNTMKISNLSSSRNAVSPDPSHASIYNRTTSTSTTTRPIPYSINDWAGRISLSISNEFGRNNNNKRGSYHHCFYASSTAIEPDEAYNRVNEEKADEEILNSGYRHNESNHQTLSLL